MRRPIVLAALLAAALTTTGLAVAHALPGSVSGVRATFALDSTDGVRVRECHGTNGHTLRIARGLWRGQVDFDQPADATVRAAFRGEVIVDTTTGLGLARGRLHFGDREHAPVWQAHLLATVTGGDDVDGLLNGRVRRGGQLIANVSAQLAGGGLRGSFGTGSGANGAVLVGGHCRPAPR